VTVCDAISPEPSLTGMSSTPQSSSFSRQWTDRYGCVGEVVQPLRSATLLSNFPQNGAPVAQRIQTIFIDDLDGGTAEGTVCFGLNGTDYEIDLSTAHAEAMRQALETYIEAGRKVSGSARRAGRGNGRRAAGGGPNSSDIREWAKAQGIEVKDRGRVPAELVVKFKAATEA